MTESMLAPGRARLAWLVGAFGRAVAALVITWPIATVPGSVCAAVGAFTGSMLAPRIARSRLRTPVVVAAGAVVLLGAVVSFSLLGRAAWFSAWTGPARAVALFDAVTFFSGALALAATLRALSIRRRSLTAIELVLTAVGFAQLVVAHRQGAIHRPFEIADPMIAQGIDPAWVFLGIGVVGSAVVLIMLVRVRSWLRLLAQLLVVALLLTAVVASTRVLGLPTPATPPGLGLRDEGGGSGSGRRNNEDLDFRDNYDSPANQVPVGVVLLHEDYSPPNGVYYLRQGAFSQYNGRRLVSATRSDVDTDLPVGFPTARTAIAGAPASGLDRAPVETTIALLADHTRPFALESVAELAPLGNPDPSRFRRVYRATSHSLSADLASIRSVPAGSEQWTADQLAHYTRGPSDPRYAELASRIVHERFPLEPLLTALAITEWLGDHGKYSLRSRHADAQDPTGHFLFGDLTGYCVHFAHAGVFLMRSVGLPARVATGYAVEESARQGGSTLVVTGAAAHAWPELYLKGVGWVVLDITPATVLDPPPPPPDPELQRLLGELLRGEQFIDEAGVPIVPLFQRMRIWGWWVAVASAAVLGALLALLFSAKLWRRFVPLVVSPQRFPRLGYRALLDALSEVSMRRGYGETREAFAARLASAVPSLGPATEIHLAAAFGGSADGDKARLLAALVRRELSSVVPFPRRLIGWLTPWSFFMSR